MKIMYIILASMLITVSACNSKKSLKETFIEIIVDDLEDLAEEQWDVDIDINGNGK